MTRLLVFSLCLGLMGCAGPSKVTTPSPSQPFPHQVPVRVTQSPVKPDRKTPLQELEELKRKRSETEEPGMQHYASAIKKVPSKRRQAKAGEKVYPLDLNLKNADLVEAVRVLADTLGLNYTIDPRVKGTVNVRATGKLSETDILGILETILLVNSATIVKVGTMHKIVPLEKSFTEGLPVYQRGVTPVGMTVQVVFPEQTAVKELVTALKPMMSAGGSITEGAHNSLILVDNPANLDKLLNLVHLIDTQSLTQTLIRVIKVHNTDPNELIGELEVIFAAYGTLAQKGKFGVGFLPVSRLNSVMILANSGPLMDRALHWVKQLDMRTDMLANVHVYNVENYKAKNLADLLTQVYGGTPSAPTVKEKKPETGIKSMGGGGMGGGSRGGGGGMGGGMGGMGGGGMGTMGGGMGSGGSLGAASPMGGGALGASPEGGGAGETAGGGALKERATPLGPGGAQSGSPKEGVRIIPDEENNLLVVVAPPHEWNIISRLLKQLDIAPRQVLNEVLIAEVRLTDELKYGIEFLLGASSTTPSTTSGGTGTTGVAVATPSSTTPGGLSGVSFVSGAGAAFSQAGGLTFVATDTLNKLKGLINLLASEGRVNILASPHIMAANNQEAQIMIGQEVPILTSQSVPLVSQTTSFQTSTVNYRQTGIILSVKPQINAKGQVTLDIAQEVSDAQTTTTGVSGTPTFSVRTAKTSLTTGDNQTIVLGGLIREDTTNTQAGIPGLRKLPLLGALFGSEGISKQKTELLVLITPHIITNLEEGARITREMKDKMGVEETRPKAPGGSAPTSAPSRGPGY